MNKSKKMFILFILINILITGIIGFFENKTYAFVEQILSSDIENIDDSKYPGIKSMIMDLQNEHKTWNFKVLYTNLKWDDVIAGEHAHGNNLVPKNSIYYDREWICTDCGTDKVYDTGRYYCASEDAIKYMIDPRNSINSADIFQFLQLSYLDCDYENLKAMVANCSYLNDETIIRQIMEMGKEKNINPCFVIAKIIQEQGEDKKDSNGNIIEKNVLVTGKKYIGTDGVTYEGYYNFLNVGASGSGNANVITNGLKYAKKKEWTSPIKSIEGGINLLANSYIKNGQDTMYFQKFNVSSRKYQYYDFQYMQYVLGAQDEGTILRRSLEKNNLINENYTFIVPLYEEMPLDACRRPISTYRMEKFGEVPVSNRGNDEIAENTNNNVENINNDAENQNVEESANTQEIEISTENQNIKIVKEQKSFTTIPGMTVKEILETTNIKEIKNNKDEILNENDKVATGCKIGDYTVVVLGDVNGDAEIDIIDLALLKRHISKVQELINMYETAGNINQDEGELDIIDLALLKRHISGTQNIKF